MAARRPDKSHRGKHKQPLSLKCLKIYSRDKCVIFRNEFLSEVECKKKTKVCT